ncbi:class Ib ribonucleoside-diphosphate reductase assembly flavoprotein NrdI [Rhodoluna limnophila]|uniref:class Ib ribonucleoside-diphosphate reductase assembly flavoprotein NrdI n=1 Tax=Rhodoluna limnophila TaxID=232537 RepID=UPI001106F5F1|nr:class Ib ribonucleoside-diphosphate reductase assembly flavoprotein NrdI [Rhodoluna limnophila]
MLDVVYFSNVSENTKRFVEKLNVRAFRIPLHASEPALQVAQPYVLISPTYGAGDDLTSVPKQVIRFLNDPENRKNAKAVIAAGNTNFGDKYCRAGEIISLKLQVPLIYKFELLGTPYDVAAVEEKMEQLWKTL